MKRCCISPRDRKVRDFGTDLLFPVALFALLAVDPGCSTPDPLTDPQHGTAALVASKNVRLTVPRFGSACSGPFCLNTPDVMSVTPGTHQVWVQKNDFNDSYAETAFTINFKEGYGYFFEYEPTPEDASGKFSYHEINLAAMPREFLIPLNKMTQEDFERLRKYDQAR